MSRLSVVISISQVKLVKMVRAMNYGVSGVIAGVSILLDRVEVMVASMMAVLSISPTEVIVRTLKRTEWTVM